MTEKREWKYGEKSDKVAEIAASYLRSTKLSVSIAELCTYVRKEIERKGLDIVIYPFRLRAIVTSPRRDFCFVKVNGSVMHLTLENGLMYDILRSVERRIKEMAEERAKLEKGGGKLLHMHDALSKTSRGEIPAAKKRA
jgi:hypothetical protein